MTAAAPVPYSDEETTEIVSGLRELLMMARKGPLYHDRTETMRSFPSEKDSSGSVREFPWTFHDHELMVDALNALPRLLATLAALASRVAAAERDEALAFLREVENCSCEIGVYWGGKPWKPRAKDCIEASVEMPKHDTEGDYSEAAWCWPCRVRGFLNKRNAALPPRAANGYEPKVLPPGTRVVVTGMAPNDGHVGYLGREGIVCDRQDMDGARYVWFSNSDEDRRRYPTIGAFEKMSVPTPHLAPAERAAHGVDEPAPAASDAVEEAIFAFGAAVGAEESEQPSVANAAKVDEALSKLRAAVARRVEEAVRAFKGALIAKWEREINISEKTEWHQGVSAVIASLCNIR